MNKPAFDPNKPFETASEHKPAFDPSQPFETETEPASFADKAKSFGSGVTQGSSFGFGDEMAGGVGAVAENIPIPFTKKSVYDYLKNKYAENVLGIEGAGDLPTADVAQNFGELGQSYREGRDFARNIDQSAAQKAPGYHLGGELLGGASSAMMPGLGGPTGLFNKAGNIGARVGQGGKVLTRAGRGIAEGALGGGIYGAGKAEGTLSEQVDQTLESGFLGGLAGGAIGGGVGVLDKTFQGPARKIPKIMKKIGKRSKELRKMGGKPEAEALEELAGSPLAAKQKAIMGPGERQEFQKGWFAKTNRVFKDLQNKKKEFDFRLRGEEAARNLENVPAEKPKVLGKVLIKQAKKNVDEVIPKGYTQKMVDEGLISQETLQADLDLRDLYKVGDLKHARAILNELDDRVSNAIDSYDVYTAMHEAEQKISKFAKYGKDQDALQRVTSNIIKDIKKSIDSFTKSEAFGAQGARQRQVDAAYSKFLNRTENLKNMLFGTIKNDLGGKEAILHPGRMQTYMTQLDELRGFQREAPFKAWLESAEEMARVMENQGGDLADDISKYIRTDLPEYEKTQTLQNQFRKLRWSDWQDKVNEGLPKTMSAKVVNKIPFMGDVAEQISKSNEIQGNTQKLIQELVSTQQDALAYQQGGGFLGSKIRQVLDNNPMQLGRYAGILNEARRKGDASLNAQSHVLMQRDPEYRKIMRQLNGQDEPR